MDMKKKFNRGINNLQHIGMDNGSILVSILVAFLVFFSCKVKIKICDIRFIGLDKNKNELKKISTINISSLKWSKKQLEMKSQILKGNYIFNNKRAYPEITIDNVCINGHHRLSVLKQVNKPNYEIVVFKLWLVNFNMIKRLLKYLNLDAEAYIMWKLSILYKEKSKKKK